MHWLVSVSFAFAGLAVAAVGLIYGFWPLILGGGVYAVFEFGMAAWRRERQGSQAA